MDLDIDDLLSEEQRVPINPTPNAGRLEFILGLRHDEELPEEVELPFWLARTLQEKRVAIPGVPKKFGPRMRSRLKAHAWAVNVREHGFYFYECALKLSFLDRAYGAGGNGMGQEEFRQVLRRGLATRYGEIMRESLSSRGQDTSAFRDGK